MAAAHIRFMNGETVAVTKTANTNPEILGVQSTWHGPGAGADAPIGKTPGKTGVSKITGK